jgi:hypothetical protein
MNTQTPTIPEPIRLWVAELRSGEYAQTTGNLQNDEGFCCLGVACKSALKSGIEVEVYGPEYAIAGNITGSSLLAQTKVLEWLNLKDGNGIFMGATFSGCSTLVDMNDGGDHSFSEIADFIEARWQDLVKEPA